MILYSSMRLYSGMRRKIISQAKSHPLRDGTEELPN